MSALLRAVGLLHAANVLEATTAASVFRLRVAAQAAALEPTHAAASLLQVRAERATSSVSVGERQSPPSFFGDFYEGESTFDADALERRPQGWDLRADDPNAKLGGVKPAVFYDESQSGGAEQAWQTHSPSLANGPANRGATVGKWSVDGRGQWNQEYVKSAVGTKDENTQKAARWFDSAVRQYDGYGRRKMPSMPEVNAGVGSFVERAVNTTLTCKEAGCTAQTNLQAFDGSKEKATNCKLSLHVHPTDFDDQYSGERLTFVKVNGVTINNDCFPMVSGCNASTQTPMFTCLRDVSLDNIIGEDGTLDITAQIPDVVDECPFQGNLLSSVPVVTCLITSKEEPVNAPPLAIKPPAQPVTPGKPPSTTGMYLISSAPLRCPERGCTANARVALEASNVPIRQCLMNVIVYQTDFDAKEGTDESIEFVRMDSSVTLKQNIRPGGNPCRQMWKKGTQMSLVDTEYPLVADENVTERLLSQGVISISAKISDHVDECAHDGYLLNGYVQVNCTLDLSATV